MWLYDIGINLMSDLFLAILAFIVFYTIFLITKRLKLLKFFGIEKSKKLTIFTSNLIVEKFGSFGNDRVRYSFQGIAIPNEESKAATQLQNLFNYFLPSQVDKQGLLSKLLISDVDVKVIPSPLGENIVEQSGSIISLGFPPYNTISRYIESTFNPRAKLIYIPEVTERNVPDNQNYLQNRRVTASGMPLEFNLAMTSGSINPSRDAAGTAVPEGVTITSGSAVPASKSGEDLHVLAAINVRDLPPFDDLSIGFIQRLIDPQNNRSLFYIAGLSENSTAGSVYYLVHNWELLQKKYGNDQPFLALIKVSETDNKISELIL